MPKINNPSYCDCRMQNCKHKDRTYPAFCPITNLNQEDIEWALERYEEDRNHEVMVASAKVEYQGDYKWVRVEEIMQFAKKINATKIGIANCIGLSNEARIFARILRANGFDPYAISCKVAGKADSLFYKYSDAYVNTLVTKDRITGNNPVAALYTAHSYYHKKFNLDKDQ